MEIKNEFEVPAPRAEVWDLMLNVERVVPCVPGAELTEIVDDSTWKGKMAVKLGPIRLTFAGEVHLEETDEAAGRVAMRAKGQETRGKGNAQASVLSVLEPTAGGTRVSITTDLKLSGPVAQYGRGMIQDVSSKMVDAFATCLASQFAAPPSADAAGKHQAAPVGSGKPVNGITLIIGALMRAAIRFFKRLFGRRQKTR